MTNISNKLMEIIVSKAYEELDKLKKKALKLSTNQDHNFNCLLSTSLLQTAIEEYSSEIGIDFIFMGAKGVSKAEEILFGSNTVRTIKTRQPTPILVVPNKFNFNLPLEIAFPTDLNRYYKSQELQPLKHIANLYNSNIRVIHIMENEFLSSSQKNNLKHLQNYLSDYGCSYDYLPNYGTKTAEINDFIVDLEIDLLTMINYKHSLTEQIFNEPVIKNMCFHPRIPFLVITGN
jgi:hypothetical protein